MTKPRRAVDCSKLPVRHVYAQGERPAPEAVATIFLNCFGDRLRERLLAKQRKQLNQQEP